GNGVLLHAELGHAEAVDDVLASQLHDDRLVRRQIELIDRRDVVLPGWIGAIESQRVRLQVEQLDVGVAEFPVRAGVVDVPGERLAGDLNHQRLALRGPAIDPRGPDGDREAEQEDHLDAEHADFDDARRVRLDCGVVRYRLPRPPETDQDVGEKRGPPDEQDRHEHVRPADQAVDLRALSRRELGKSEPASPVHDVLGAFWSSDHSSSSSSPTMRCPRLGRYTKTPTTAPPPATTPPTTTSPPICLALTIVFSSAQTHVGRAGTLDPPPATTKTAVVRSCLNRRIVRV